VVINIQIKMIKILNLYAGIGGNRRLYFKMKKLIFSKLPVRTGLEKVLKKIKM